MARIRRLAGQKRVGHAGTLDPLAEGVLLVLLGRATRLADYIQAGHKTYVATVKLGVSTETDDAEGSVLGVAAVPPLSRAGVESVLARFTGEILQAPPKYSAVKVAGRRAYAVARAGGEVELAPRPVTIYDVRLLDCSDSELCLEVCCSKGTYIRSLARDIALALGTLGHLSGLVRTRVGPFSIADSLTLDEVAARGVADALLPASRALPDAPVLCAGSDDARRLGNGQPIPAHGLRSDSVWVYDPGQQLVCLASADGALVKPRLAL